MRCALAFSRSNAGHFLVTLETQDTLGKPRYSVTSFDDENIFIQRTVLADVDEDTIRSIIAGVLLAVSDRLPPNDWTIADLTEGELHALGLRQESHSIATEDPNRQLGSNLDLTEVLLQAPIAIALLTGPRHHITLINDAYTKVLGRKRRECLLGKEVRVALTESGNQPFVQFLDKVYATGKPHVGVEFRAELYKEELDSVEESYFDFIFHPLKNSRGDVYGILALATDVTERVLSKFVSDSRESQLYRQWSELAAIYNRAPVGVCVLDAAEFSIIKINRLFADFLNMDFATAVGKTVGQTHLYSSSLKTLLRWVTNGQTVENHEITISSSGRDQVWLLNLTPSMDAFGKVEAILASALDITSQKETELVSNVGSSKSRSFTLIGEIAFYVVGLLCTGC